MKLKFSYDKTNDVLYANIGKPKSALSEEIGGGIAIKIDIETHKPIGFIIIDYMKRVHKNILRPIPNFKDVKLPQY
jgi:uncharacterized protein YuzE